MNPTSPTATVAPQQVGALDWLEAHLKSQPHALLFPGMVVHHKDLVLTDKTKEALKEEKTWKPGPINPAGNLTLHTPESFAKATTDYSKTTTKVFADSECSKIIAVFDFLEATEGKKDQKSGWGQLTASIEFSESRKLKEWKRTLEWMNQLEFANFIEDHLEDVLTPTGQDLMTIVTDLEASSTGGFKGKVNLDNGSVRLSYQDDVETTVEVPRYLTLGIPLFEHGDRYKLGARLRFVIQGGSVKFRLLFINLADAKEQEFERIVQEIEEKTSTTIYRGRLALPW